MFTYHRLPTRNLRRTFSAPIFTSEEGLEGGEDQALNQHQMTTNDAASFLKVCLRIRPWLTRDGPHTHSPPAAVEAISRTSAMFRWSNDDRNEDEEEKEEQKNKPLAMGKHFRFDAVFPSTATTSDKNVFLFPPLPWWVLVLNREA